MSFVSWANAAPPWLRNSIIVLLLLLTIPVGWASISISPPGSIVANWWPAAPLAIVAATLARRNQRFVVVAAVIAVAFASNLVGDRPVLVALGFGIANAAEALIVAAIATRRSGEVSIDRARDAKRLLLAVVAGSGALGLIVALVVGLEGGDPLGASLSVVAAHSSAVLLLAPFAILPVTSFRTEHPGELAAHVLVLLIVLGFVFAPGQSLSLIFLVLPAVVWSTARFETGIVAVETLLTAIIISGSLYWRGGPFTLAPNVDLALATQVTQLCIIVLAMTSLVLGRARADRLRIGALSRAREVVLLSGITGSAVGFVILRRDAGAQLRFAAVNDVANDLLNREGVRWKADDVATLDALPIALATPLAELIAGRESTWNGNISAGSERIVSAHLSRVRSAPGTVVVTVQAEDVTLRERALLANERALENERATVEQLRETNRHQDAFVSAVSHELRTPLTSIIGYSDELSQLDLPDEAHTYLEVVTRNAERLGSLVEDLLEVGRLNSQVQFTAREKIDVDAVVSAVVRDLHHPAAARSIAIERSGATGSLLVTVRTDITRILVNLISNAIKFSPVGGRIEIIVDVSVMHLQIRVKDAGPGISAEDLDRVFERFYRARAAATIPGSGLGLVIARGLAENLGGSVRLHSAVGVGTTALLTLPLSPGRAQRVSSD